MNDTEMLKWVAEHLTRFELGLESGYMEYIDNYGFHRTVKYRCYETNKPDVDILKECIRMALSDNMPQ